MFQHQSLKMKKINFFEWYSLLPLEQKKAVRDEIMSLTGISYPGFYSWLNRQAMHKVAQKMLLQYGKEKFNIEFTFETSKTVKQ